jgi:hypothetical protein
MGDNPPALELYKKGKDAADKFDYFVCTVSGAIFAYIAQHYTPKVLAINAALLEPVSLLVLAGSFFCGLKRIELGATIIHIDRDLTILIQQQSMDAAERLKSALSQAQARSKRLYIWRDRLLLAGFVTIFLAKVLQPYGENSSAHATTIAQPAQIQAQSVQPMASPIPFQPAMTAGTNKTSK